MLCNWSCWRYGRQTWQFRRTCGGCNGKTPMCAVRSAPCTFCGRVEADQQAVKDAISQVLAIVPALQQLQQNLPQGGSSVAIPGLPRVDQPNFLRNMGMTIATRPAAQFSQAVGLAPLNEIGELEIEDRIHLDVITQRSKSKGLVAHDSSCFG